MPPDSLRAVLDSVFAAPAYRWVDQPEPWYAFLIRWLQAASAWVLGLRESHPLGFRLFLAGLVLVLVVILVHAGWVLLHTIRAGPRPEALPDRSVGRRDRSWYRREADRLAQEGRFVEAIQADFLALVLALDAEGLLRFHPGKTPGEYTRESRLAPGARQEFQALVQTLYGFAFARRPCGRDDFERWRAAARPERYAGAY